MTTSTHILTGLALSPKVQIKIQILHHVSELVVVRVLSELNTHTHTLFNLQSQSQGLILYPKISDGLQSRSETSDKRSAMYSIYKNKMRPTCRCDSSEKQQTA